MRLLASVAPGEVRLALLRGDDLLGAWIDRPARPDGVGDIHRARVTAIAPAMSGAFVALGDDETGFLPEGEAGPERQPIARVVQEGMLLPVRVIRAAQGGKGPRVSARLTTAEAALAAAGGGDPPCLVARGPEAALRLARAYPGASVETDGAMLAARLRAALGPGRVRLDHQPVFDDTLEAEFEALAAPVVPLAGGGRLLIHPTPALTAIDVDAGPIAGSADPNAQYRLNERAVEEAARQIRLRNLAGAILVDLAGLRPRQRQSLSGTFERALGADSLVRFHGLGPLGLFELQRQRVHPPLHEMLGMPPTALSHGLAALRRLRREVMANPGARYRLVAAPRVLGALRGLPGALDEAAALLGEPLALAADAAVALGQERLEPLRRAG